MGAEESRERQTRAQESAEIEELREALAAQERKVASLTAQVNTQPTTAHHTTAHHTPQPTTHHTTHHTTPHHTITGM